jgi:hypothetical protein
MRGAFEVLQYLYLKYGLNGPAAWLDTMPLTGEVGVL